MRIVAALSLAAALIAGSLSSASAFVHPYIDAGRLALEEVETSFDPTPYDPCHGRSSGTAHWSCGSATGGPSGGLF